MSEIKKYLNDDGEFVEKDRYRSASIDDDDDDISLANFRRKREFEKSVDKNELLERKPRYSPSHREASPSMGKTAEDRAKSMVISRASSIKHTGSQPHTRTAQELSEERRLRIAKEAEAAERAQSPQRQSGGRSSGSSGGRSGGTTGGSSAKNSPQKRRKKKRIRSFGLFSLLIVIALALCTVFAVYYSVMAIVLAGVNHVEIDSNWGDEAVSELSGTEILDESYLTNILLLGLDDSGGSGSRSDTMIVASIDSRHNKIRLCSVQRDDWVYIPGVGNNRVNAAYAFGGAELAMRTVEANFRVKLDGYVSIDIESLIEVIDIIGGVDIEITAKEATYLNKYSFSELMAYEGMQHMDGDLAVCYARMRKIDSDFGRTSRQRTLINAIVQKCKNDYSIPGLLRLAGALSPYVTTSLGTSEISTLALKAAPTLVNDMEQMSLPVEGHFEYGYAGDMAVIYIDLAANVELLHEFLRG